MSALERWNPGQHVVTESLSGAIVTQTIICHGPSHPKLPQPSPGKHTGVAEFVFNGAALPAGSRGEAQLLGHATSLHTVTCMTCKDRMHDLPGLVRSGRQQTASDWGWQPLWMQWS